MKKQINTKQKLFETLEKIDPSFKPKVIQETNDGFKRQEYFSIYNKEGDYLGDTDPIANSEYMYIDTRSGLFDTQEFQKLAQEKNFTPEMVGRIVRDYIYSLNGNPLNYEYYSPSQSNELFDPKTNTFYNRAGQTLRDPSEYERYGDGTNQWGERYDDDY